MPSREFPVRLSEDDLARLQAAVATLQELVAKVPVPDAEPALPWPAADQGGPVYNTISGSPKNAMQCRDISGNVDLR